ncbi:lysylphosphatidylglycerol synthase transmembrane domain-containing protein [Capnocytophaga canis]|uniref:lysylphosphatidylglycerol synthase transmembrane domain-containing protein n=1 Tax=Capnocytophaga TaxID=1016 RepID=UPI000BB18FBA|nr:MULTISPECIES: lysylphosphatidylglycerol synthase transmembrane domain-containing protein [unclassified Capnocytophaga]ATA71967.1 TIGR00374 family protein [Capnocytophaga sp. H4358]ATA74084.1 TIGR00374 family protein [Capnocytophaga sp. H2931]
MMKLIKTILPLFLGVFLCWYAYSQFTDEQLNEIKEKFLKADYFYIILSVLLGFLSNVSRALRWELLLNPMGYKTRSYNRIMAVFIGYLVNVTIPRSGEISRALVVNRYDGVPFDKSIGTIISERVVDLILLLSFTLTAFLLQFNLISEFLLSIIPFQKLIFLLGIVLVLGVLFSIWVYKSTHFIALKVRNFVAGLKEGIFSILKLRRRGAFLLHTIFIWTMYVLMFYLPFLALPETSYVSIGTVLTSFVVGSFAIAFTNGGFGSYPFFIAEILLLFGIPLVSGTAFGWIVWTAQFFMTLFFGGISFILLPLLNRYREDEKCFFLRMRKIPKTRNS